MCRTITCTHTHACILTRTPWRHYRVSHKALQCCVECLHRTCLWESHSFAWYTQPSAEQQIEIRQTFEYIINITSLSSNCKIYTGTNIKLCYWDNVGIDYARWCLNTLFIVGHFSRRPTNQSERSRNSPWTDFQPMAYDALLFIEIAFGQYIKHCASF